MRLPLKLHPESRCEAVAGIEVETVRTAPSTLSLRYLVSGAVDGILLPAQAGPGRADGLWQHTCLEAFLRQRGEAGYREFNLAPSSRWAAYGFDGYRSGMELLETRPPRIETELDESCLELRALLDLPGAGPWQLALCAVIEETNGRKSYWALAHPAAKPDFHHPDSFTCELP
jgi:hypothetical protein